MLFNSYIFILFFLPVTLSIYFLLNRFNKYILSNIWLICMSLWFYAYFNTSYLAIILISISGNYIISRMLYTKPVNKKVWIKKTVLIVGILINTGSIFYFKYFDFFLKNVNTLFNQTFELKNILLPLGISFFTFQQISYLVDSYRGETRDYGFVEYALFVCFFPQLIAGPIVLHSEVIPQFRDREQRKFNHDNMARGLYVFAVGLFKKVLIADTFAKAVDWGFSSYTGLSSMDTLLVSLFYTFQLYFDFSGYCDMALGIGSMFNIKLPNNFNSPYKALSITDFWSRWHMSLTRFLKTYIYIPLGGNRKGRVRTYINIMIVYIVSGIWHGANWTFILWGFIHGILNCLNRMFKNIWDKLGKVTQWAVTFMTVNVLWVIFRADNISSAVMFIKKMFNMSSFTISRELYNAFLLPELTLMSKFPIIRQITSRVMGFDLWLFIFGAFFIVLNLNNSKEIEFKPTAARSAATVILTVWSVISLSGVSTFLYFNF